MIKSVTVINHLGQSLKMVLTNPDSAGFYIQRIEGLGPVGATVNVVERAVMDGASYNSARVGSRNIVMYLGFSLSGNIEVIRHRSYKYFPVKKRITIQIETDTRICETYGYVESNDVGVFGKGISTQISIICPDSYFYEAGSNAKNVVKFEGVDPLFEFPFSNESLGENLIEFGEIQQMVEYPIFYSGDVDVGVEIYIHAIGSASKISIYNETTKERMVILTERLKTILETDFEIINGDDIVITTSRGEKSITLIRDGERYNIINCLERYPDWFQLTYGDNIFMYEAEAGGHNLQFRIEYKTAYEGV